MRFSKFDLTIDINLTLGIPPCSFCRMLIPNRDVYHRPRSMLFRTKEAYNDPIQMAIVNATSRWM